jgi:hypothetical protein
MWHFEVAQTPQGRENERLRKHNHRISHGERKTYTLPWKSLQTMGFVTFRHRIVEGLSLLLLGRKSDFATSRPPLPSAGACVLAARPSLARVHNEFCQRHIGIEPYSTVTLHGRGKILSSPAQKRSSPRSFCHALLVKSH